MEEGKLVSAEAGTPQGAVASPLLANIYLHYVFDLWADRWRKRHARGRVIIVRFADDIIIGFEHEGEARRFLADMRQRLEKFALSLHPDKTRLIEFGRYAAETPSTARSSKPETFNFLGFTHICGRSSRGVFQLKRQTRRDRMRARLRAIKEELQRRMHEPIPLQGKWLRQVVRGYFAYHAVPTNCKALSTFRHYVMDLWRQSAPAPEPKRPVDMGTDRSTCKGVLAFIPYPSSLAERTLRRQIPKVGARCVNHARRDLCGGCSAMSIPTAIEYL